MAFVLAAFDDSLDSRDLSHDTIQPRREQPHVRFTAESTPRAVRLCHHSAQPVCSIIAVVFDLALNGTKIPGSHKYLPIGTFRIGSQKYFQLVSQNSLYN
jgi:hypothetical protein